MDVGTMKNIVLADSIDRLINLDFHGRGILYPVYEITRKKIGLPLTYVAAKGLVDRLAHQKDAVVIIGTGFLIPPHNKPETDGVVGTALLARGLDLAFNVTSIIVTESEAVENLIWTCTAAGLNAYTDLDKAVKYPHSVGILPISKNEETAQLESLKLLKMYNPDVMISIERPGKNKMGIYHGALGNDIGERVAKVDGLFTAIQERGGFTVGIGDLGNELGVGNASMDIAQHIPFGAKCRCSCGGGTACAVASNAPIIGMSSEVATYGLLAALNIFTEKKVLHDATLQRHVLWESVMHGAVDGPTGRPTATIDIMSSESIERIVELLHDIIRYTEQHTKLRPEFLDFLVKKDLA